MKAVFALCCFCCSCDTRDEWCRGDSCDRNETVTPLSTFLRRLRCTPSLPSSKPNDTISAGHCSRGIISLCAPVRADKDAGACYPASYDCRIACDRDAGMRDGTRGHPRSDRNRTTLLPIWSRRVASGATYRAGMVRGALCVASYSLVLKARVKIKDSRNASGYMLV